MLEWQNGRATVEYKLKRFLQGSLLSPERAHIFWNGTFSEEEKQKLFLNANSRPLAEVVAGMVGRTSLQSYLDFDQRYYLPDDILYKVDRMSVAHSLEVRPQFLDPRIVDLANQQPTTVQAARSYVQGGIAPLNAEQVAGHGPASAQNRI